MVAQIEAIDRQADPSEATAGGPYRPRPRTGDTADMVERIGETA